MKKILAKLYDISFWQSLQTVVLSLLLLDLLVPVPKRFTTYAIGTGFVIAFIHWCLLPKEGKRNHAWTYALPYLVFYGLMFFSGLLSGNIFLSLQWLWRYTPFLFIPLIFVGMTPEFFNRKRIRIFAFALVFGVLAGYFWRVGVLAFDYSRPDAVRELGRNDAFQEFYKRVIGTPRKRLGHPAFEALFGNAAIALVLVSWAKNDVFFNRYYKKVAAFVYVFLISVNILLFCTKTAALCCIMVLLSVLIYALCRKNYRFFGVLVTLGLVLVCSFVLLLGKQENTVGERYQRTESAMKDFLEEDGNMECDGSFVPRLFCHIQSWEMFREKPIIGWGPAYGKEFQERFKENFSDKTGGRYPEGLKYPHSEFLEVALIGGVSGLLIFVWLLLSALRSVSRKKDLYWWLWFGLLVVFCIVESIFDRTVGFVYLCGFHGVLFCQGSE